MELRGEEGSTGVGDTLVTVIIGVEEEGLPVGRQRVAVHGVPVVLRGDVAFGGAQVDAGLVHAAVAVFHLVRLGTARQSQKLITQTDAEDGLGRFEGECPSHGGDGGLAHGGVTRPVAEEHTLVGNLRVDGEQGVRRSGK